MGRFSSTEMECQGRAPYFPLLSGQVFCQLCNFLVMVNVTLALTSLGDKFPLGHHLNIMMAAVNYLPGQVCFSKDLLSILQITEVHHACGSETDDGKLLWLQVRVSVFAPILAVQSAVWVVVGGIQRQYNPLHSAPPITT